VYLKNIKLYIYKKKKGLCIK